MKKKLCSVLIIVLMLVIFTGCDTVTGKDSYVLLESGLDHRNGHTYFEGIINLETGKYTAIKTFDVENITN